MYIKSIAKEWQNTYDWIVIMTNWWEKLALPWETHDVPDHVWRWYLLNYPSTFIEVLTWNSSYNNDKAIIKMEQVINSLVERVWILEDRIDELEWIDINNDEQIDNNNDQIDNVQVNKKKR
jgi:hypothetical protein